MIAAVLMHPNWHVIAHLMAVIIFLSHRRKGIKRIVMTEKLYYRRYTSLSNSDSNLKYAALTISYYEIKLIWQGKMDFFNSRYFIINKKMLNIIGLWSNQSCTQKYFIRSVYGFFMCVSLIPQVRYFITFISTWRNILLMY